MKKVNPYLIGILIVVIILSFVRGYFNLNIDSINVIAILKITGYVLADILIPLLIAGVIATIGIVRKNIDWNRTFIFFVGAWFILAALDYLPK